jgi:hypothetical protein
MYASIAGELSKERVRDIVERSARSRHVRGRRPKPTRYPVPHTPEA